MSNSQEDSSNDTTIRGQTIACHKPSYYIECKEVVRGSRKESSSKDRRFQQRFQQRQWTDTGQVWGDTNNTKVAKEARPVLHWKINVILFQALMTKCHQCVGYVSTSLYNRFKQLQTRRKKLRGNKKGKMRKVDTRSPCHTYHHKLFSQFICLVLRAPLDGIHCSSRRGRQKKGGRQIDAWLSKIMRVVGTLMPTWQRAKNEFVLV